MNTRRQAVIAAIALTSLTAATALADPCGMVPPVYIGAGQTMKTVDVQQM